MIIEDACHAADLPTGAMFQEAATRHGGCDGADLSVEVFHNQSAAYMSTVDCVAECKYIYVV